MQNLIYYVLCSFIWGSTYLVITYQIDSASPITSVFYRFLIATTLLWGLCFLKKQILRFNRQQHQRLVFQGLFLFCLNYVLIYNAEKHVTSGLLALILMVMVYFNILGMRFVFNRPISRNVYWGAALGGLGLIIVFYDELRKSHFSMELLLGLLFGIGAALCSSIGNLISYKNTTEKLPILTTNAWGMLYGTIWCLLISLLLQESFTVRWSFSFVGALLYLSIFGTLIAFGAYLTLVAQIGAERAVYTTVISPIIALVLSSVFEGFPWTWSVTLGVLLCTLGNFLTLSGSLFKKLQSTNI